MPAAHDALNPEALNLEQRQAVRASLLLVLAGAGSGNRSPHGSPL
jgi:hypothetical protein